MVLDIEIDYNNLILAHDKSMSILLILSWDFFLVLYPSSWNLTPHTNMVAIVATYFK